MCSTKYDFNIPDLQCLYASLCNNTEVMWPLFIEIIVSFCVKITRKIYVTQGKLRENTGNFILATMWPPCLVQTKKKSGKTLRKNQGI